MAFDPISGTVSIICLIILIVVTLALYMHQNRYQKLTDAQINDIVDQINHAHLHHYALTKKQRDESKEVKKDVNALKTSATSPHFSKVYLGKDYELYQLNDQLRVSRQAGKNMTSGLHVTGDIMGEKICADDVCLNKSEVQTLKKIVVPAEIIMNNFLGSTDQLPMFVSSTAPAPFFRN